MKPFLLVLCISAIIAGCRKGSPISPIGNNSVFGKWELRTERGGLQPDKNYLAGNGKGLQLNIDSTYHYFDKSVIGRQGTYHIAPNSLSMTQMTLNFIYYDHATYGDLIIRKTDTLSIGDSSADGLTSIYVRIKPNHWHNSHIFTACTASLTSCTRKISAPLVNAIVFKAVVPLRASSAVIPRLP